MADQASSKRFAAAGGGDRLSALPDELLHSIMSFLPARQVVQTSVLSPRWRGLWRSTPCLDIDHREFAATAAAAAVVRRGTPDQVTWAKLLDFTAGLLAKHDAPVLDMDRFRLHVGAWCDANVVGDWIRRGVGRYHPAALEVTVASSSARLTLPRLVPADAAAACRRLARMRLCGVHLNGSFAAQLRPGGGCPVLEDLVLTRCYCSFQEIVSSTLKSLAIEGCSSSSSIVSRTVAAPALASFRLELHKNTRQDAFLVNGEACGSLSHASISCEHDVCFFLNKNLFTLLGTLCNVTTLELWKFGYGTLDDEKAKFPKLHNLTTLLMGKCDMAKQFNLLRFFVKNVPSLEKITLKHCQYSSSVIRKRKIATRYKNLLCYNYQDLKLIGIKYKDTNTSNLFGLLMGIRMKLEANTVILNKELRTNSTCTN